MITEAKKAMLKSVAAEFICVLFGVFAVFCWGQFAATGKVTLLENLRPALCWAAAASTVFYGLNEFLLPGKE